MRRISADQCLDELQANLARNGNSEAASLLASRRQGQEERRKALLNATPLGRQVMGEQAQFREMTVSLPPGYAAVETPTGYEVVPKDAHFAGPARQEPPGQQGERRRRLLSSTPLGRQVLQEKAS